MRIGIDARMIDHSGIGTFLRNTIKHIRSDDEQLEYVLFGDPLKLKQYGHTSIAADYPVYGLKEQLILPWQIRASKPDLAFFPHYVVPLMLRCRMVVTIQDLIHLLFPEYYPKLGYHYAKAMVSAACGKASRIVTLSEYTKQDIVKHCGVPPSRISAVGAGVDSAFCVPAAQAPTIKRFGQYILYVGAIRPHKNVLALIEAFKLLKSSHKLDGYKLILIGKGKEPYLSQVREKISGASLDNEILILQGVSNEELPSFYQSAELFVFPSLYEGFGLPPLEAMACGCPVVASNASSIPEVTGDAAILVNARNVNELADAMIQSLTNSGLRRDLFEKGLVRARLFSWEKTARNIAMVFLEVLQ